MPHSVKKTGAPITRTEPSQKTAKPPHIRLKGIKKASTGRKTKPWQGRPAHKNFSPEPSSCSIIGRASKSIADCIEVTSPERREVPSSVTHAHRHWICADPDFFAVKAS